MDRTTSSNHFGQSSELSDLSSRALSEHFSAEELNDFTLSSYPQVSKIVISNDSEKPAPQKLAKAESHYQETKIPPAASFHIGQKRRSAKVLPLGDSESMQHIRLQIAQVANFDVSVLITGASGAGKEVIAQQIHAQSGRSDKPFVAINCGAIPEELLESEMFGHEKGAFTGAIAARLGRFEMAQGGTLFLDEIGDMPLLMQVKILRVLQEQCFERIGGNQSIKSDVRIIAATHRDLPKFIAEGKFREDLFYRLNVFPMHVLPLNERKDDLAELLVYFIQALDKPLRFVVSNEVMSVLSQYHWPGNVRELQNLVQRLAIVGQNRDIVVQDLPQQILMATVSKINQHQYEVSKLKHSRADAPIQSSFFQTETSAPDRMTQRESLDSALGGDCRIQSESAEHFSDGAGFTDQLENFSQVDAIDAPYIPNNIYEEQMSTPPSYTKTEHVSPSDIVDSAYAPSFNRIKTEALRQESVLREKQLEKVSFAIDEVITEAQVLDVALAASLGNEGVDVKLLLHEIEKSYIVKALDKTGGVVAKAARLLKLRRTTLVEKMKKMNMSV